MVGATRSWIAGLLPLEEPLDDLVMITSELATNTLAHTRSGQPGGRFTIDLAWSVGTVRLSVGDQGSLDLPVPTPKTAQQVEADESGRGPILVDTLAVAWGTTGDATARWVWADVLWPADNGAPADWREPADAAARALAGLQETYPGTLAWYGQQTRSWWATLPGSPGSASDRLLTAPCLTALSQALAARHLASSRP